LRKPAISRMLRRRKIAPAQSGQTIVELALLLPLLLLLVVGVTEIGRYAYYDILVANAARAGAAYGAQGLAQAADNAGITEAAHRDGLTTLTITPIQQCGCSAAGLGGCPSGAVCPTPLVYIEVTASENFTSLFSYPGLPANLTLTSTVKMRVSQ
jgi:Flp pilus assembly protein TadG